MALDRALAVFFPETVPVMGMLLACCSPHPARLSKFIVSIPWMFPDFPAQYTKTGAPPWFFQESSPV
jgi:hypothetical protein